MKKTLILMVVGLCICTSLIAQQKVRKLLIGKWVFDRAATLEIEQCSFCQSKTSFPPDDDGSFEITFQKNGTYTVVNIFEGMGKEEEGNWELRLDEPDAKLSAEIEELQCSLLNNALARYGGILKLLTSQGNHSDEAWIVQVTKNRFILIDDDCGLAMKKDK